VIVVSEALKAFSLTQCRLLYRGFHHSRGTLRDRTANDSLSDVVRGFEVAETYLIFQVRSNGRF
jgi:hypothetical protein